MTRSLEGRFEQYSDAMVAALGHADRDQPARQYLKGLMLAGGARALSRWRCGWRPRRCARPISPCTIWWRRRRGAMGVVGGRSA